MSGSSGALDSDGPRIPRIRARLAMVGGRPVFRHEPPEGAEP